MRDGIPRQRLGEGLDVLQRVAEAAAVLDDQVVDSLQHFAGVLGDVLRRGKRGIERRRVLLRALERIPVSLTTTLDRVEPGEPMKLTAEVVDPAFVEVNDARVIAQVTTPSGKTVDVPLEWSVSKDGDYRGSFVPDEPGMYEIRATASRAEGDLGTSVLHARASAGDSEYFDAAMRSSLLQRVAEDTGGRFFTTDEASALPEAINFSGRGVTVVEERDLWDMPIILMLMLTLVGAEWGYRRTRGLA